MSAAETMRGAVEGVRSWLFDPPEAPVVCEIAADYVTAVRQHGGVVEAWASRPLPEGVLRPGPLTDNFGDPAPVQRVLDEVVGAVGGAPGPCAVIVPDALTRVSVLDIDQLPSRPAEVEALVRWRLSQDLQFDLDQAELSYQVQKGTHDRDEVVAAIGLRHLIRQYEERFLALGLEPGVVTISLLALLGGFPHDDKPRLLVKRTPTSLSLAVAKGGAVRLFRSVPLAASFAGRSGAAGLYEKIYPALVYYKENAEEPVETASLWGFGDEAEELKARLKQDAGCDADEMNALPADLPPSALEPEVNPAWLLPCLGWVRAENEILPR